MREVKLYKKGDKEYRANGIYVVDDATYMSLWSFKKRRGDINPLRNNSHLGKKLSRLGVPAILTVPDAGTYDTILCYRKDLLSELKFI